MRDQEKRGGERHPEWQSRGLLYGLRGGAPGRSREGAGVSHEAVLCLVVAVVVQAAVVVVVVIVLERWLIDGSHLASARRGCDYGGVRRDMAL